MIAACGGQVDHRADPPPPYEKWCNDEHTLACPEWKICAPDVPPPLGPCMVPGDTVGASPGRCHAITCEVLWESGAHGDGGPGQLLCAAACEAACAGDPIDEKVNYDEAWAKWGVRCAY